MCHHNDLPSVLTFLEQNIPFTLCLKLYIYMYFNTCIRDTGNACVNMIAKSPGYMITHLFCVYSNYFLCTSHNILTNAFINFQINFTLFVQKITTEISCEII